MFCASIEMQKKEKKYMLVREWEFICVKMSGYGILKGE